MKVIKDLKKNMKDTRRKKGILNIMENKNDTKGIREKVIK